VAPQNGLKCGVTVSGYIQTNKPRPLPQITCAGGKVINGKCLCGKGLNRSAPGTMRSRCIKTTTSTVKTPPLAAPKVVCVGGVVRSNRCFCPSGKSLKNGVCTASGKPLTSSGRWGVR
jgi:hypothetical protein